jgi:adenine-specific DNA-methyltransferase
MTPYYEEDGIQIWNADCREVLPMLPKVDLVLTDPPYFRVKGEAWDRQWGDADAFLEWIGGLCDSWLSVLNQNGSLFVFASPQMAWAVEGEVRKRFNVLNSIRWMKRDGWHNKADEESLRSYLSPWESIIFAEQFGIDKSARTEYTEAERMLHKQVYSPIGGAIARRRLAVGLKRHEVDTACSPSRKPTGLCYRWEEGACLPTLDQFVSFLRLCGDSREYEALRSEYEALRSEYEALRRPFNLGMGLPRFDVWEYPTVSGSITGKHPTEKPVFLIEDMVRATCRDDSLILDCFLGSGTTALVAKRLGLRCIGIERERKYCDIAIERLRQQVLFAPEPQPQPQQESLL